MQSRKESLCIAQEQAASRRRSPPRRAPALGPSPHIFWVLVEQVSEQEASRRRSPSRRPTARVPAPLHTTPALTMTRWGDFLVVMVRAGVVWSGAGTIIYQRLHIAHFQMHIGLVYERSFFSTAIAGSGQRPGMNHSTYFTFPAIKHYRPFFGQYVYRCLLRRFNVLFNYIFGFCSLFNP